MPVIKRTSPDQRGRQELVGRLVDELRSPGETGQPLILQNPIGETDQFNVYVIWDKWLGIPHSVRTRLILDAYHGFDQSSNNIVIADGVTMEEAIQGGLLPVKIVAFLKKSDSCTFDEIRDAMIGEGAIETAGGLELRFPTLEDGRSTFERLQARFPNCFGFVQELPAATD